MGQRGQVAVLQGSKVLHQTTGMPLQSSFNLLAPDLHGAAGAGGCTARQLHAAQRFHQGALAGRLAATQHLERAERKQHSQY